MNGNKTQLIDHPCHGWQSITDVTSKEVNGSLLESFRVSSQSCLIHCGICLIGHVVAVAAGRQ